jgi:hypothetical protein
MAEALPFIQGALGLAQLAQTVQGPPKPPPAPELPPTLGWDEAMRRSTETLSPIYDERMQNTLAGLDKELIQRGFFGQLPGAVLAGSRAADVERAKAAAIASLGGQMQSQSEDQALAQQRLAAEWAMNQSALWNQTQQQRQQGLGNLLNTSLYYPLHHQEATYEWPWQTWERERRAREQQMAPEANLTPKAQYLAGKAGVNYFGSAEGVPIYQGLNPSPLRLNQYTNPWGS